MRRFIVVVACLCLAAHEPYAILPDGQTAAGSRRMSFHNRLLLNRAAVAGLRSIEVLLLSKESTSRDGGGVVGELASQVARAGGRVLKSEPEIGYLRIELPPERLVELTSSPLIEGYQISSMSRGSWYRDGPPLSNAENFRSFEVTPIATVEPASSFDHLPPVTPAEALAPGFTADDGAGVGEWMKAHPTFDGRGVTIALLETAQPAFADPAFRTAKTLDGREVPKIAGILNAIEPEYDDETRVRLTTRVEARRSWTRVGGRTYVMPAPGTYWLGVLDVPAGGNAVHRFAIVEDDATRAIWIDANGDASFQDEQPLADINQRFDPRVLTITFPRKVDVGFVMGRGTEPHVVNIYLGTKGHQTMTASVAAGHRTVASLASGVAPNARLLFVRMHGSNYALPNLFEGFIQAAKRRDIDVLSSSAGLSLIPDTDEDFSGLLFSRLTATYGKPIVNAAGNFGFLLGQTYSGGGALSVGGTLGPETWAALHGGRALPGTIVHQMSAAGPAIDGAIKPDFLAPVERLSATSAWLTELESTPHNAPTRRVPPGYQISCCTSASSPYAAGVVALLISAARQSNVPYSVESLSRAMRVTARPIPGFQAHRQGNGALDVNAAWQEMRRLSDPVRITASADIVHPLAQYAASGRVGKGILEFEGWTAGMSGMREIRLRRESGPREPVTYRLGWSADDGTFTTPASIALPLGVSVPLPVNIDVRKSGAHSGLLTLRDAGTDVVVFRTQATIVASERIDSAIKSVQVNGRLSVLQQDAHYLQVPGGVGAAAFQLDVKSGVINVSLIRSHGLISNYYSHVHPMDTLSFGPGRHHLLMPNPEPGTWTLRARNSSTWVPARLGLGPRSDADAEYTLEMRILQASIQTSAAANGGVALDIANEGSALAEPVIEGWPGGLESHRQQLQRNGLPNLIEIDVPARAQTLWLRLRSEAKTELFLYDCTTGECFSYDLAFPGATSHALTVRKPAKGRWVAAINAAPFPVSAGSFVLDEVIAMGTPIRRSSAASLEPGGHWPEVLETLPALPAMEKRTPVVLFELHDAAAEQREAREPWNPHPRFVKLRDRPVAIGTAIYRP